MTQTEQIFDHLKRNGSIDPMTALREYGCFRLAARVAELREAGHDVKTQMISRGEKRHARYVYHAA